MPLSTAPFCHHVAKPFSTICESTVFIGLCGGVGLTAVAKADSSDWESGLLCLHVSQKGSVPLSRPMLVSESISLKRVNTPASSADNSTQLQTCRSGIWEAGVFAPLLSEKQFRRSWYFGSKIQNTLNLTPMAWFSAIWNSRNIPSCWIVPKSWTHNCTKRPGPVESADLRF